MVKVEYEIREKFDGSFSTVRLTKKKIKTVFRYYWLTLDTEILFVGASKAEATKAMLDRVKSEKGDLVKCVEKFDSSGDLRTEDYLW